MNSKQVRELLKRWGKTLEAIGYLHRENKKLILWANDALDTLKAYSLDGMPKGAKHSDLSDNISEHDRRQRKALDIFDANTQRISDLIETKFYVDSLIDDLTPKEMQVIFLRYKDGKPWGLVAANMHLCEDHVRRIERQVIKKIMEAIG